MIQQLRTPEEYDELGEEIGREQVEENVRVSADLEWLQRDLSLGVDKLTLHNVNREQERFIDDFGERVLPELD